MTKVKLVVLDDYEGALSNSPAMNNIRELVQVNILNEPVSEKNYSLLKEANIILALRERTKIDKNFLEKCQNLELIIQTGGHAYHIDIDEVTKKGVLIALGRGAKQPMNVVPELTFGLILGLIRKIYSINERMKKGEWPNDMGISLAGKTLGILGYGRHGKPTARIAEAFKMNVIAWNRTNNYNINDEFGIKRFSLDYILENSDILSIHLKLTEETKKLLDYNKLSKMKKNSLLINTSRGQIIDEEALIKILKESKIGGAGLDVYSIEPLPKDSPLRNLDNVLLTPHIGWKVDSVLNEFADIAYKQLHNWLNNKLDPNVIINTEALEIDIKRSGSLIT